MIEGTNEAEKNMEPKVTRKREKTTQGKKDHNKGKRKRMQQQKQLDYETERNR